MAQLINITSEALQATIRRLLPSQQGFGEDLQATNVVTPIIDLTPTAEGSALPISLAQAMDHGGSTEFDVSAATSNLTSTPGFYRVLCNTAISVGSAATRDAIMQISDGTTTKSVYFVNTITGNQDEVVVYEADLIVFLRAGDTLQVNSSAGTRMTGTFRQVADVNGNTTNPVGFVTQ